jgi:hypothetical protein
MILEMGAGLAVPTVRSTCEALFDQWEMRPPLFELIQEMYVQYKEL